ncbi:magnesium and cobalt transport protein CorA [Peribacillus butanolivorans]|uniref:Magnesium transport protein CorA n=2 Tax=Peribacillus butanolivorans TaxID=421767 RepID=A0ABM6XT41_9BACI|nr:magnesium and cobalt transport protein CorA [Peribacillus butanolivorans]
MHMIRTCAITSDQEVNFDLPLVEMNNPDIEWYWVDFSNPTEKEIELLSSHFHFHPLAIEDCLDDFNQRPKMDFYEGYQFIVIHALRQKVFRAVELDMFVGEKWLVTFHKEELLELETVWKEVHQNNMLKQGPFFLMHRLIDRIVDEFFPPVYKMESELSSIEDNTENETITDLMDQLFDLRTDMSRLRRTILPMRDLLYRMISSERLNYLKDQHLYFNDVYDHLLKLTEMLESYRDFSSDIRDSYLSVNSNNMNSTMMTLTVITTIFMPLTFIVGVYGMNFQYMPELNWHYGYFLVLGMMGGIALMMFLYFVKKGWLNPRKRSRKS